ncbi:peptidoglycan bridge formation glycyltransferase FemA/FemB family protein [Streptomyces sp. RK23]|uniref:lipid II:glycine glycyltransferase FemX n=1 Tax=Streptomyces TaxID=1883 RepID=UPI001B36A99E|nr:MULTISPECIES: peptidoglycan bridge formation glycyltransferase FemA/FemB family protein [unclassified Streptomyces]MBQ0962577.1 peptidoglycan bridge formation glycyltransferase FemA/FemB family protein [Streptomyces sp. RK74B]MBQ1002607.1 peptidoglycan bridge formation glycyltransferase FemA/FemB family protein [Streptomyces sp. RK23]
MAYSEPVPTADPTRSHPARVAGVSPTVRPISAAEHLAFVRAQRSVSFLQTPAWGRVKTEWRSESLGWYDGPRLVGAGLVLHRPVPRLQRYTLAYLPEGPVIDWTGDIAVWLDPLAAYLKARGAFAIRLGPPVRTDVWSADQVKEGIADASTRRLTDVNAHWTDPVGAGVTGRLRDAGWLPQSPEDGFGVGHPQFKYELPLAGRTEDDLLKGMNQLWRRNIRKAAKEGVEVTVGRVTGEQVTDGRDTGGHGPARRGMAGRDADGQGVSGEDLHAFHELYVHTAERDRFTPRPLRYFETMFAVLGAEAPERVGLYLACHRGDLVAATVMVRVGTHAVYAYGASSTEKREVRGSNACQWAMIRDALAAGCDVYDLRGITPTLDADDPHVGLVQFKVGTGGQAVRYVGEWDLPLRPLVYRTFDLYMKRRGR